MKMDITIIILSSSISAWAQFVSEVGIKVDHQFSGIRGEQQMARPWAAELTLGSNLSNRFSSSFFNALTILKSVDSC